MRLISRFPSVCPTSTSSGSVQTEKRSCKSTGYAEHCPVDDAKSVTITGVDHWDKAQCKEDGNGDGVGNQEVSDQSRSLGPTVVEVSNVLLQCLEDSPELLAPVISFDVLCVISSSVLLVVDFHLGIINALLPLRIVLTVVPVLTVVRILLRSSITESVVETRSDGFRKSTSIW